MQSPLLRRRSLGRHCGGDPAQSLFADRELELLGGLAQQTKLALHSAESYETLERTFVSTVEALANALEANDEYTSTHARWITDLALKVGVELGLDAKQLKGLELGALFHDIGKIGIPSAILMKAGPLTPEERAVVETHPLLGERILEPIAQLARWGIVRAVTSASTAPAIPTISQGTDSDRVSDHLRLRRLPRDDDRPPVPARAEHRGSARPPARGSRPAVRSACRRNVPARPQTA